MPHPSRASCGLDGRPRSHPRPLIEERDALECDRKNELVVPRQQGSLADNRRRLNTPIRNYLADVLSELPSRSIQSLFELTPTAHAVNLAPSSASRLSTV